MYVLHVLTYMSNLLVFAQETKKWNTNTKIKRYNYVGTARNYLWFTTQNSGVCGLSLMLSTMYMTLLFTDLYY